MPRKNLLTDERLLNSIGVFVGPDGRKILPPYYPEWERLKSDIREQRRNKRMTKRQILDIMYEDYERLKAKKRGTRK